MIAKTQNYLKEKIMWRRSTNAEYPYVAELDNEQLVVRVNDFPDESLYTLFVNDEEIISFDDWPKQWIRPEK